MGVTGLALLEIVAGIVDILFGFLFIAVYSLSLTILGMGASSLGFFLLPMIALFFIVGFISLVLSYGLWTGRGWAWVSAIVLAIIGVVTSLVGLILGSYLNVIPAVFYFVILGYLATRSVRSFFGRAPAYWPQAPAFPPGPYPQSYAPAMQTGTAPYPQSTPFSYGLTAPPGYPSFPQHTQPPYYPEQSSCVASRQPFRRTGMCPACLSPVELTAARCLRCGSRLQ